MTTICPYSVTGRVCELNDDVDRLTRDLAEAKAELAAARKDAERYRFLRSRHRIGQWIVSQWMHIGRYECAGHDETLDAAIDKARQS